MIERIVNFLTKPVNSLTYKELVLHSFFSSILGVVAGFFCAILIDSLIGGGWIFFNAFIIISILNFFFFIFKPLFERWIRYESDFGKNYVYYEAKSFSLLFFGIVVDIFVVSFLILENPSFILLVGYALSFFFPFLVVFLRRDYLYNENGALEVANDYEFAYDLPVLLLGAFYLSFRTIPIGFSALSFYIGGSLFSLGLSMLVILFEAVIFYLYLCPDFWNKYLPFDVKKGKKGMFKYIVTAGIVISLINILLFG